MNRRLTIAMVGVVLVALTCSGVGLFVFARVGNRSEAFHKLESQSAALSADLPNLLGPAGSSLSAAQRQAIRQRLLSFMQLSDINEVILTPGDQIRGTLPSFVRFHKRDLTSLRAGATVRGSSGNHLWAATGRETTRGTTLVTVVDQTQERLFGTTARWFAISAVIALGIASFAAALLARRLSAPVHAAVDTTGRIAAGDLGARVDPAFTQGNDELALLARSVNEMGDRLERSRGLERQFLMSVSHDLRTPLTSIKGYSEAIVDGVASDPVAAAGVIRSQAERLDHLVKDLLDLAKLDAKAFSFAIARCDLNELLAASMTSIVPAAAAAGIALTSVAAPEGTQILVDPERFAQVLGNLCSNAIRYARGVVRVEAKPFEGWVAIHVTDNGNGIAEADLPHIFERLYRAADTVEAKESGSGLGLAIVRDLTEQMGGRVSVTSELGVGSTFTLTFPA
jgi:signal transduction histidine kinase